MLKLVKDIANNLGLDTRLIYQKLSAASLKSAIREQGLAQLIDKLREIIPDISDQYTEGFDPTEYSRCWELKMRGMHAFQTNLMLEAISYVGGTGMVVVDVGDSSGNHGHYLMKLAPLGQIARVISVNLDPGAVEKIREKGGEAIQCRAEELDLGESNIELFMCFEMIEHLTDPIRFLHRLATSNKAKHLLITVPYRKTSRFGGGVLSMNDNELPARLTAESLHVFELPPQDWLLLARLAGWRPVFTRVYWQYPRRSFLRLMAPLWRKLDFEGFFGVLLTRDLVLAERYLDW